MSKSRRATKYEAKQKIQEIREMYALGREALKLPKSLSIADQAVELNRSASKVGVARRFAAPGKGYTQDQLDNLCDLIMKHRALIGTSHVEILITIPWPEREDFQSECVEENWSRRELIAEKTKHFRPKSKGGRPPQIKLADAVVQIEDFANSFCRLYGQMKKPRDFVPSIFEGLPATLRDRLEEATPIMQRVRKAALAHLKATQQAG